MEYKVITYWIPDIDEHDEDIKGFMILINEALARGWRLQGGVSCIPVEKTYLLMQALVRGNDGLDMIYEMR